MVLKKGVILFKISIFYYLTFLCKIEGKNCNFNIQVKQTLRNEGFHRNLSIKIDFASDNVEERKLYSECMIGIEQALPSGVYSTLEEINNYGCENLMHVIFKSPVDIELPAEKAEPIVIHLLSKVRDYRTHIYIPVHARYHQAAAGGGKAKNEIPQPKLYLLCYKKRLDICNNLYTDVSSANKFCSEDMGIKDCSWKEIPIIIVTAPITWDVPVGNTDHYHIVAYSTATVIILGSLYLLKTLHEYKVDIHRNNKKKLS